MLSIRIGHKCYLTKTPTSPRDRYRHGKPILDAREAMPSLPKIYSISKCYTTSGSTGSAYEGELLIKGYVSGKSMETPCKL